MVLLYTLDGGRNWEDIYANRITEKNWNVQIYDMEEEAAFEFFLRIIIKDGRIMLGKKDEQNYKVKIRDNTNNQKYKAQVRITDDNLVTCRTALLSL